MAVKVDYEVLKAAGMTQEEWLVKKGYGARSTRLPNFEQHLAIEELARYLGIQTQDLAGQLGYSPYDVDENCWDERGRYVECRMHRRVSIIPRPPLPNENSEFQDLDHSFPRLQLHHR